MKRLRPDSDPTEKFVMHSIPSQEAQESPTQKVAPVESELKNMFGKACRDCINVDFGMHLTRDDCKYARNPDGHRTVGRCAYCGRSRPLVLGLKLASRIKMRFS
ncbi:MAG: hypothetical protein IJT77_14665 [Clostridia bacterium]|nr:hypothetical protein [Clostridia bacterium]